MRTIDTGDVITLDGLMEEFSTADLLPPTARLALDLPPRLLDEEFGPAAIVRFEDVDFPGTLTHEPTRRFLREVGLPENGSWYELDTDLPLQTLVEYYADDEDFTNLPAGAAHLIRLGHLLQNTSLLLNGTTGAILSWNEREATLHPLNADVSTLALTTWLMHRGRSWTQPTP